MIYSNLRFIIKNGRRNKLSLKARSFNEHSHIKLALVFEKQSENIMFVTSINNAKDICRNNSEIDYIEVEGLVNSLKEELLKRERI